MSLNMDLTRTGLGYIFSVLDGQDEILRFEISGMVKTVWGIRGRITVRSRLPGARVVPGMKGNYLTTEVMDFLSGKSRQMFSDRLSTLIPAPPGGAAIDLTLIVEQMVALVMDQEHRVPVTADLSTVQVVAHTPHIYPYFLPEGKTTILYGAGGVGKSAFVAALAAAVQTGTRFLGNPTKQCNVLYLDWETDQGDVAHRIAAASRGIGLTSIAPVKYMALELPLELEMTHIAAAVAEDDIGFVILDSVGMASSQGRDGSDPASGAIEFFRALRILNATVLCIDHISGEDQRRGRAGASKPYGSIFKWNTARNAFEMIEAGEDGRIILRHRKANLGPKMPGGEVMVKVIWEDITDTVSYRKVVVSEPAVSLVERITDALSTGPASYRNLLDLLNSDQAYDLVDEAQVRGASKALLTSDAISVDNSGVLRLTTRVDIKGDENTDAPTEPIAFPEEEEVDSA